MAGGAHANSDKGSSRVKKARPFMGRVNHWLPNASQQARDEYQAAHKRGSGSTMCPLCSESAVTSGRCNGTTRKVDPLTGCCNNKNACSKRRAELDDETIEFLGLIPRERENHDGQSNGNGSTTRAAHGAAPRMRAVPFQAHGPVPVQRADDLRPVLERHELGKARGGVSSAASEAKEGAAR